MLGTNLIAQSHALAVFFGVPSVFFVFFALLTASPAALAVFFGVPSVFFGAPSVFFVFFALLTASPADPLACSLDARFFPFLFCDFPFCSHEQFHKSSCNL